MIAIIVLYIVQYDRGQADQRLMRRIVVAG